MSDPTNELLARLVRTEVPALFLLLDDEDRVLECNRHTREMLRPPIVGSRFADLVVNFDRATSPAALAGPEPVSRPLNFMTFTGLPQTLTCWIARAGGHVVVVGGAEPSDVERLRRDLVLITGELGNANRALQKANAELAQLSRLKDLFLGMASHDLRSPITAVLSYAELLEEDLGPRCGPEQQGYLSSLRSAGEAMRQIVDRFLDVTIIEMGQLRVERQLVAPADVATEAIRLASPSARRRRVDVWLASGDGGAPARLDTALLRQALVNLIVNAIEHSPAGSAVEVRADRGPAHVEFAVTDHGSGVPPEIQRDLFSAFTGGGRRKPSGERSLGLGLAITRRVVEAHGGTIAVESQPGRGSTFTIRLPLDP